jgi:hypothetical protein
VGLTLTVLDEMTVVRHSARYGVSSVYALERYTTSAFVLYSISKLADEQSDHKTTSEKHSQPPREQSSRSVYLVSRSMNWRQCWRVGLPTPSPGTGQTSLSVFRQPIHVSILGADRCPENTLGWDTAILSFQLRSIHTHSPSSAVGVTGHR